MGDERKKRGGALALTAIALVVLVLLYLLSIGPAFLLWERGYISENFLSSFYAPVSWAAGNCRPFKDIMTWYVHLWWSA
jgi:hypothetical protein